MSEEELNAGKKIYWFVFSLILVFLTPLLLGFIRFFTIYANQLEMIK